MLLKSHYAIHIKYTEKIVDAIIFNNLHFIDIDYDSKVAEYKRELARSFQASHTLQHNFNIWSVNLDILPDVYNTWRAVL